VEWPARFYERKAGIGCPACEEGRPDENEHGVRFFAGDLTDAYLNRLGIQRGFTQVHFRARHVVEPTELTPEESLGFWNELLTVGRLLERVFEPVKLNYQLLGNSVPHLHAHVIPRYADDPRPEWPFPFPTPDPPPFPDEQLRADVELLKAAGREARPER
jgi:diadenosine tetraphosphate (Ap4A) HIT family hydrolase